MPTRYNKCSFELDLTNLRNSVNYSMETGRFSFSTPSKSPIDDIEKVIFNFPATIVIFKNGTKEVVKCNEEDMGMYDPEVGFAMCMMNRIFGSRSAFKRFIKKCIHNEEV